MIAEGSVKVTFASYSKNLTSITILKRGWMMTRKTANRIWLSHTSLSRQAKKKVYSR
jgi:hypothetical protein